GIIPEKVRLRIDKMGFPTPEAEWLQSASGEFAETLGLITDQNEIFDVRNIELQLNSYLSGNKGYDFLPWKWFNMVKWLQMVGINP
ncbi:hypothetical protein KA005_18245, partial [bacterium]|nr:hypothetical protein [bacterium]